MTINTLSKSTAYACLLHCLSTVSWLATGGRLGWELEVGGIEGRCGEGQTMRPLVLQM
jgi:hypothetical protein